MYNGLLIDMGGTIVENKNTNLENGIRAIYPLIDSKVDYNQFSTCFQKESQILMNRDKVEIPFATILKNVQKSLHITFNQPIQDVEYQFAQGYETLKPIKGIEEVFSLFHRQNKKIIILSNSSFSNQTLLHQLDNLHLSKYLYKVLSSADYLVRKPYIEFFQKGIKFWHADEQILYVGNDYYFDIIGASKTSLQLCWYNPHEEINENNISCINIKNYQQLIKHLERNMYV